MATHRFLYLNSRRYALADLLGGVGDRLRYVYDLGDLWQVALEVVEVVPECPAFALLGGQGAWAPEDSNGCPDKGNRSYLKLLRDVRKQGAAAHGEALREAAGHSACLPYQRDERGRLRVFHFEAAPHEAGVRAALAEPFGKQGVGPRRMVMRFDWVRGMVQEEVGPGEGGIGGVGMGRLSPGQLAEALKLTALCGGCGSPHGLKPSKCQDAKFCSRECQAEAWPRHKADCKKLAAGGKR